MIQGLAAVMTYHLSRSASRRVEWHQERNPLLLGRLERVHAQRSEGGAGVDAAQRSVRRSGTEHREERQQMLVRGMVALGMRRPPTVIEQRLGVARLGARSDPFDELADVWRLVRLPCG